MDTADGDDRCVPVGQWDIPADKQRMGEEHPLQVARCTKIIPGSISLAATAAAAQQAGGAASSSSSSSSSEGGANGESGGSSRPPAPPAAGGLGGLAGALGGGSDKKPNADEADKYVINVKQIAKFVVGLGEKVASTDIEEGMRVGCVHFSFPPVIRVSDAQYRANHASHAFAASPAKSTRSRSRSRPRSTPP